MRRWRLNFILCLWVAVALGDQSEIDKEIIKDFEFFYHMETVENQEMLEMPGVDVEGAEKGVPDEEP